MENLTWKKLEKIPLHVVEVLRVFGLQAFCRGINYLRTYKKDPLLYLRVSFCSALKCVGLKIAEVVMDGVLLTNGGLSD